MDNNVEGSEQQPQPNAEFASKFERFRERLKLKKWEMAQQLGVPESNVFRWENPTGKGGTPRFQHLKAIYRLAQKHDLWPEFFIDSRKSPMVRTITESEKDLKEGHYFACVSLDGKQRTGRLVARVLLTMDKCDAELVKITGLRPDINHPGQYLFGLTAFIEDTSKVREIHHRVKALRGVLGIVYPDHAIGGDDSR